MKKLLFYLAISIAVMGCQNQKPDKPNVLIILVDDLGWTDLTSFRSDFYQTPNIDQLASDGVRFTNSYSACTVCSPTRASVMTGKYPARLHVTDWIKGHIYPWAQLSVPDWTMYLDTAEITLAEAFKSAGYTTAHVGKWHLGDQESNWPEYHGFDTNVAGWSKGAPNRNRKKGTRGYFSPYGNPRLEDGPEGEYLTERLTNEVCEILESKGEAPFFINFCLYNVHTPLQATENKIEKYVALVDSSKNQKNPIYAAMVEHTDDAVGRVIQKLKDEGLYENTIILFSSDNGGLIGNGLRKVTSNLPLRHGKGGMYEGGVRIPTILYAPGIAAPNKEIHVPVITPDYYPTLLELAGIAIPEGQKREMDGISWSPLFQGDSLLDRDAIFWHYPHYHSEGAVPYSAMRSGDWKLVENLESGTLELYNLKEDIGETTDLAAKYPGQLKMLKEQLDSWRTSVGAQFPTENPDYDPERARKKKPYVF